MSTERSLSLVSDETMVAIAAENETLREVQARLQRRIVELETQITEARTSVAEKKNADRIKALEDLIYEMADPDKGVLPAVRQELFERRSRVEEAINRINNSLQGEYVQRAEFDVLVATVKTWKASHETENTR